MATVGITVAAEEGSGAPMRDIVAGIIVAAVGCTVAVVRIDVTAVGVIMAAAGVIMAAVGPLWPQWGSLWLQLGSLRPPWGLALCCAALSSTVLHRSAPFSTVRPCTAHSSGVY